MATDPRQQFIDAARRLRRRRRAMCVGDSWLSAISSASWRRSAHRDASVQQQSGNKYAATNREADDAASYVARLMSRPEEADDRVARALDQNLENDIQEKVRDESNDANEHMTGNFP